MKKAISILEANRQNGQHQMDERRSEILDAAEKLFLQNGLVNIRMIDIAAEAGISKMSLYRYFPNRDEIATEIHARMLNKIASAIPADTLGNSLQSVKVIARLMIDNFDALHDAYRYMGMFDSLYLDMPADSEISQAAKQRLTPLLSFGDAREEKFNEAMHSSRFNIVVSTVIWFLEKLAMRGELTWSDESTPLNEHLLLFEEMIVGYLDGLMESQQA